MKEVDFSLPYFVTGARLAVRSNSKADDLQNMSGATVAVVAGSTAERIVADQNRQATSMGHCFTIKQVANNDEGVKAVASGKVDAFSTNDVLLAGAIAHNQLGEKLRCGGRMMSVEPFAIMVRKGDTKFLAIIDGVVSDVLRSGEAERLATKWMDAPELKYTLNYMTRETFRFPVKYAAYL